MVLIETRVNDYSTCFDKWVEIKKEDMKEL